MSEHLAQQGVGVLGIDVVPEAVAPDPGPRRRARCTATSSTTCRARAGGPARCSPTATSASGETRCALLRRVAGLLAPDGRVVADVAPPGDGAEHPQHRARVRRACAPTRSRGRSSAPSPCTEVAAAAGLAVDAVHEHEGRWFVVLGRARLMRAPRPPREEDFTSTAARAGGRGPGRPVARHLLHRRVPDRRLEPPLPGPAVLAEHPDPAGVDLPGHPGPARTCPVRRPCRCCWSSSTPSTPSCSRRCRSDSVRELRPAPAGAGVDRACSWRPRSSSWRPGC